MHALSLAAFDAFVIQLSHHDWYYEMADDGRVYRRGRQAHKDLINQAKANPILLMAYSTWEQWQFDQTHTFVDRVCKRTEAIAQIRAYLEAGITYGALIKQLTTVEA